MTIETDAGFPPPQTHTSSTGKVFTAIALHPPRLRWRIYYRTAQKIASHQKTWEEAHKVDAVAVVWQYGDGEIHRELGTPYYVNLHDWIARCWDPTLYLRQLNQVKFGRWAKTETFMACWSRALGEVLRKDADPEHAAMAGTVVVNTHVAVAGDHPFQWKAWYDDGNVYTGYSMDDWAKLPTDGVMCVYYHHILNGILVCLAVRRYTYYYWKNGELINTDDIDLCVNEYSQFKKGCPAFTGQSYLDYGLAIQQAMTDMLEDVT